MVELSNIKRVYFIGIGGIGMSALARYFHEKGVVVSGYDRGTSELITQLEQEGIPVHFEESIELADRQADWVIYTPAIPESHSELDYFRKNGYSLLKRSEALQHILEEYYCISVAGTHGKTTTSTLIAHTLRQSGYGCNAFLGGISTNYQSNYWSNKRQLAVVEADEYDRSFLRLNPDLAVLTAMDPDHMEIYQTVEALEDAFVQYTRNIKEGGTLIYKHLLNRTHDFGGTHRISYSLSDTAADYYARNIRIQDGEYRFDIVGKGKEYSEFALQIGGLHNIENAIAATAILQVLPLDTEKIREGLATFRGVHRRFEYQIKRFDQVYIDDYAHHPEELRTLIHSARELHPEMHCRVIFQPHLFSRTRDLASAFASSLELADQVILLPIYPAREAPIDGISSYTIAKLMKNTPVKVQEKEEVLKSIGKQTSGLLITAGAGDIDRLVPEIKQVLGKNR